MYLPILDNYGSYRASKTSLEMSRIVAFVSLLVNNFIRENLYSTGFNIRIIKNNQLNYKVLQMDIVCANICN